MNALDSSHITDNGNCRVDSNKFGCDDDDAGIREANMLCLKCLAECVGFGIAVAIVIWLIIWVFSPICPLEYGTYLRIIFYSSLSYPWIFIFYHGVKWHRDRRNEPETEQREKLFSTEEAYEDSMTNEEEFGPPVELVDKCVQSVESFCRRQPWIKTGINQQREGGANSRGNVGVDRGTKNSEKPSEHQRRSRSRQYADVFPEPPVKNAFNDEREKPAFPTPCPNPVPAPVTFTWEGLECVRGTDGKCTIAVKMQNCKAHETCSPENCHVTSIPCLSCHNVHN